MGIYVNPGINNLKMSKKNQYYVDKSMIITKLNELVESENRFICVSRPRRFGKTMAANMIAAYYSKGCDSHEIFSDLEISKDPSFDEYINKYTVIKIDMNNAMNMKKNRSISEYIDDKVIPELRIAFPNIVIPKECILPEAIQIIYAQTGEKFVFLIDEYDVIIRDNLNQKELEDYLSLLVSLFKGSEVNVAIALAYLTGIMPIIKEKTQSKLNNFTEYTMLDADILAPYMGFTEDEVKKLCNKANMDFDELKRWYDGYKLNGLEIYSPKSVITAIEKKCCKDYWSITGTYISIRDLIQMNFEGIRECIVKMIAGEKIAIDSYSYRNSMTDFETRDDVFVCLIHLGYLGYDNLTNECFIPNYELKSEWIRTIKVTSGYKCVMDYINNSKKLLEATWERDEKAVSQMVEKTHMEVTSNLTYNNEGSFSSAIRLAYFYADSYYKVVNELPAGKGYADIAFIHIKPEIDSILLRWNVNRVNLGS
ncbi:MAG: AAA family ATPase [Spirochaetales bacterium]|nr:AAA family ATPase [Spirochaetales bacterium]